MADQEQPNRRVSAYASSDHEVEYFRGMLEKTLRRSREAMSSESLKQLAPAFAKAQAEFSTPKRTEEAWITQTRKYNYADLQDVIACVREPLAKHGLSVTQLTQEFAGQLELVTLLLHDSGEWLRSVYPVKAKTEEHQKFGSAMTYARRYTLSALLGIASEEDDDAQGAQDAQKGVQQPAEPKPPVQAPEPAGEPLQLMSPETTGIEGTWPRTSEGAKEFMRQLETACQHDARYWRLHAEEARMIAEHPKLKGRLKVDDEPIAAMVDRLDGMYSGVQIDEEDGGVSPLI